MEKGELVRITDKNTKKVIGDYRVTDMIKLCDSTAFGLEDESENRIAIRQYGNDGFRYGMREVSVERI